VRGGEGRGGEGDGRGMGVWLRCFWVHGRGRARARREKKGGGGAFEGMGGWKASRFVRGGYVLCVVCSVQHLQGEELVSGQGGSVK
jgi:hypothetical protein